MEGTKANVHRPALPSRIEMRSEEGSEILIYHIGGNPSHIQHRPQKEVKIGDMIALYDRKNAIRDRSTRRSLYILMRKGSKAESVSYLEDLLGLGTDTKVAFVQDRMFVRRRNPSSDSAEGAFVEWGKPFVSWQAETRPEIVIAGDVEIIGHVVLDGLHRDYSMDGISSLQGRYIQEGTPENPIVITGPDLNPLLTVKV